MTETEIGNRGWLGNPFALSDGYSRAESITKFKEVFLERLHEDPAFADAVADLHGKQLGCWCQRLDADGPACHAGVIADAADVIADVR